jgi:hypothetical protein
MRWITTGLEWVTLRLVLLGHLVSLYVTGAASWPHFPTPSLLYFSLQYIWDISWSLGYFWFSNFDRVLTCVHLWSAPLLHPLLSWLGLGWNQLEVDIDAEHWADEQLSVVYQADRTFMRNNSWAHHGPSNLQTSLGHLSDGNQLHLGVSLSPLHYTCILASSGWTLPSLPSSKHLTCKPLHLPPTWEVVLVFLLLCNKWSQT